MGLNSINEIWYNTFSIVSEPGDATKYEYLVYRDGPDEFCFMPTTNNFRYPQRLNYYTVNKLPANREALRNEKERATIMSLAEKEKCNPNTLMECIRTIRNLHPRKMK